MSEEIMTRESFEERMKNRIRKDIGKLMTDEELSEIVKRAMNDIFFSATIERSGYKTVEHPPFLHELLKELLEPLMRKAIIDYIVSHEKEVMAGVVKVMELGAGNAVLRAIQAMFQQDLFSFQCNVQNTLERMGGR